MFIRRILTVFSIGRLIFSPCLPICAIASLILLASLAASQTSSPRLQSIESAIQTSAFSPRPVPVIVRGIVTFSHRQIVIEDRTGATEVLPSAATEIALGDEVEVAGRMTLAPVPQVQEGIVRRLWGGSTPLPLSITPDQAADGENELFLVQTVAELVDFAPAGLTGVRLNLRGGHQDFSAVLPSDTGGGELSTQSMQPGNRLRLTGILMINHGLEAGHADAFTLQLRTPEDIEIVEGPSWWTRAHKLLLGGIGMILALAAFTGYYLLKQARYRAIAEERASIARDIHDTVAQGYAGIALQLEAAQQMIERDPRRAWALLDEALQLIRHSRDESHLSIDILRSLSRNDRLDLLVAHCVQQLSAASGVAIEQLITGAPCMLPYQLVNNLFRIAQEALANAVKHANANKITVRVGYQKSGVLIEVEDDGRGFNREDAPGPDQGHFGLAGMRERCAAINARLELESSASGTRICVMVAI